MNANVQREEESELIAAIGAGDAQLYHRLIRPYERCVYMMSLCCMKNEKDAEDVAQATFVRAFRDLWKFQGNSRFSAWLISIVLSEANNRLRRQATVRIAPQREEKPVTPALLPGWRELPSGVIEREEIRALLRMAIEVLPDICWQVLLLRDVEEFNVTDTAQILNVNASSVKASLHQARMTLQSFLTPKLSAITNASAHRGEPHD